MCLAPPVRVAGLAGPGRPWTYRFASGLALGSVVCVPKVDVHWSCRQSEQKWPGLSRGGLVSVPPPPPPPTL